MQPVELLCDNKPAAVLGGTEVASLRVSLSQNPLPLRLCPSKFSVAKNIE